MNPRHNLFEIINRVPLKKGHPTEEIGSLRGVLTMSRRDDQICFVLKTRFGRQYVLQPGYMSSTKLGSYLWEQVVVSGVIDRQSQSIKPKTIAPLLDPTDSWNEESYNFGAEIKVTHIFDRIRGESLVPLAA